MVKDVSDLAVITWLNVSSQHAKHAKDGASKLSHYGSSKCKNSETAKV